MPQKGLSVHVPWGVCKMLSGAGFVSSCASPFQLCDWGRCVPSEQVSSSVKCLAGNSTRMWAKGHSRYMVPIVHVFALDKPVSASLFLPLSGHKGMSGLLWIRKVGEPPLQAGKHRAVFRKLPQRHTASGLK